MRDSLSPMIYVIIFLAVVLALQAILDLVFTGRDKRQRVNRRLTMLASGLQRQNVYASLVRKSSFKAGDNVFSQLRGRLDIYLRQAGLDKKPAQILTLFSAGTIGLWLVLEILGRNLIFEGRMITGVLALLVSAGLNASLLMLWIQRARARLLRMLEEQMPLALDVIVRAIRAGHPVISAVQLAGTEMGDPIGSEFGLIVDETTYGLEFREALENFARRTGSMDAHFFAASIGVQTETGGNLAEILIGLADVIRGRGMLAKRVKTLSSEGRASALLLSALPTFLIGFLLFIQPAFYTSKFNDPIFWPTAAGVGLVYLLGLMMIRRIINFRY
jgi:tight adherence protein B